jgi:transposase
MVRPRIEPELTKVHPQAAGIDIGASEHWVSIPAECVHIQRMQKALTEMNVQLDRVVSDITGVTGMAIIRALRSGERDPQKLAALKDPRAKRSIAEIAAALVGDYRAEHLFVLKQELSLYDTYQQQIQQCDQQIEQCLSEFDSQNDEPLPPRPKGKKPSRNAPNFDLRSHLYRISGVDFTQIDGLEALTVQAIIAEVGLDPNRFPSSKHFTSWLGICPGSKISGGKILSSKTRTVVNRASNAFRIAAQSLANSQTALGGFDRRIRTRSGAPVAITATAHKLARIFYHLWTTGEDFVATGVDAYEQQYQQRIVKHLKQRAKQMGFDLVPELIMG